MEDQPARLTKAVVASLVYLSLWCDMFVDSRTESGTGSNPPLSTSVSGSCVVAEPRLQAEYICHPDQFDKIGVCEDEKLELKCPRGKYVVVLSAEFGRAKSSCSPNLNADCPMACVVETVKRLCQGKRKCAMFADERTLGSGTPGGGRNCASRGDRYLVVIHTCVTKTMVREISSDEPFTDPCTDRDTDISTGGGTPDDFLPGSGTRHLPDDDVIIPIETLPPSRPTVAVTTTTTAATTAYTTTTTSPTVVVTRSWTARTITTTPTTTRQASVFSRDRDMSHDHDGDFDAIDVVYGAKERRLTPSLNNFRPIQLSTHYERTSVSSLLARDTTTVSRTTAEASIVRRVVQDASHGDPSDDFHIILYDWIKTTRFATENREKLMLYSVLSLCVGLIAVLAALIGRLVRRTTLNSSSNGGSRSSWRQRNGCKHGGDGLGVSGAGGGISAAADRPLTSTMTCSSPATWRMPDSSSSIAGYDRSVGSAGDEDVEMMSFNRLDSLHRSQHQQQQQQQQPQPTQQQQQQQQQQEQQLRTTATINRSYNGQLRISHPPSGAAIAAPGNGLPPLVGQNSGVGVPVSAQDASSGRSSIGGGEPQYINQGGPNGGLAQTHPLNGGQIPGSGVVGSGGMSLGRPNGGVVGGGPVASHTLPQGSTTRVVRLLSNSASGGSDEEEFATPLPPISRAGMGTDFSTLPTSGVKTMNGGLTLMNGSAVGGGGSLTNGGYATLGNGGHMMNGDVRDGFPHHQHPPGSLSRNGGLKAGGEYRPIHGGGFPSPPSPANASSRHPTTASMMMMMHNNGGGGGTLPYQINDGGRICAVHSAGIGGYNSSSQWTGSLGRPGIGTQLNPCGRDYRIPAGAGMVASGGDPGVRTLQPSGNIHR